MTGSILIGIGYQKVSVGSMMVATAHPKETAVPSAGRHEAPRRELLPGVTRRSALLVVGVLLLQLGFVLSYVGAFHAPTPRQIPVAVVAPAGAPARPPPPGGRPPRGPGGHPHPAPGAG